jgi:hypothetical protein
VFEDASRAPRKDYLESCRNEGRKVVTHLALGQRGKDLSTFAASPFSFSPTPGNSAIASVDSLDYLPQINERGLILPEIHL